MEQQHPASKPYSPELKERTLHMVHDLKPADPADSGATTQVTRQLGVGVGVGVKRLHLWVNQAEVDAVAPGDLTTEERAEHMELRTKSNELQRSNETKAFLSLSLLQSDSTRSGQSVAPCSKPPRRRASDRHSVDYYQ